MTASVRTAGLWKAIAGVSVRVGGAWKDVASGHVRVSGAWKPFYSAAETPPPDPEPDPITASVDDDSLVWNNIFGNGSVWQTDPITVTVTGGSGSYSIVWSAVAGDAAPTTSGLTTAFSSPFGNPGTIVRGVVTDDVSSATTETPDVSID